MTQPATYKMRVIVLRKRDLGESDLVVTLLAEDGSRIEAVAKGARKPQNAQSARLEVFSCSEVHFARGKTLDIAKESRVITSYQSVRDDFEKAACAAVLAETIEKTLVKGTDLPKLYPMTLAALDALSSSSVVTCPSIVAAHMLKLFAYHGIRPCLTTCVRCGKRIDITDDTKALLSYEEGGLVCADCRSNAETVLVDSSTLGWAQTFLMTPFAEIEPLKPKPKTAYDVLQFCHQWVRIHFGLHLKSLNYLFTVCTFDQAHQMPENTE